MNKRNRKRIALPTLRLILVLAAVLIIAVTIVILFATGTVERMFGNAVRLKEGEVAVVFVSVGQGDCSIIKAGETVVVIDAGVGGSGELIDAALANIGARKIDYMILTHPHADHIGGAREIIMRYRISEIIMTTLPSYLVPSNLTYENLMHEISVSNIPVTYFVVGDIINLGDYGYIEVLSPYANSEFDGMNNYSLVLRYVYNLTSFLFMGDSEREAEQEILYDGYDIQCDVIKLGHHGSKYSTAPAFISRTNAVYAVVSCGKDNSYGYPHKEVLERCAHCGVEVLRTDEQGNIVFISDGRDVRLQK